MSVTKSQKKIISIDSESDVASRLSYLENNEYKVIYFESVSAASGTVTIPTGATILLTEFQGGESAYPSTISNSEPTGDLPQTAGGVAITVSSFDASGNYTLSGTPSSYPVAIIYCIKIKAIYWQNLTTDNIVDFVPVNINLLSGITGYTGSGTLIAKGTSPTFATDITTPLIIGGSAVGSNITYKSTSGTGTTTAAAHTFTGGTNGGTTIATLYNNGNVNIGNYASPNNLRLVTIGQDTAYASFGSLVGGTGSFAMYALQASPSSSNYSLAVTSTSLLLNTSNSLYLQRAGANLYSIENSGITHGWTCNTVSTGAYTNFTFTVGANTGQTASTEIPNFKVTGNTKTWAAGALSTQRFNWFSANTAAAAGASTFTAIHNFYSDAPVAGSNMTATNLYAAGFGGHVFIANSVGVPSNNPTGGGILYVESGALKYRGSSGTITTLGAA